MLQVENLSPIQLRKSALVFSTLLPGVHRGRALYLEQLTGLPDEFREFATEHYHRRVAKAVDHVLLGEFMPWMIAEWFGCSRTASVKDVCGNWLLLYFSIILLDDALDDPELMNCEKALIVSSLLQQRGLCGLLANAKNQAKLRQTIDQSYRDTALAAASELRKKGEGLGSFSRKEIVRSGKKLSFTKICVDAIADQVGATDERVDALNDILDNLMSALQLMDDLTDWDEDRCPRRATMPLVLLEERLHHNSTEQDDTHLLYGLISTGALEDTLKAALALVVECKKQNEDSQFSNRGWWMRYLDNLNDVGCQVLGEICQARVSLIAVAPRMRDYDQLTGAQQLTLRKTVSRVQKQLQIVAQSS